MLLRCFNKNLVFLLSKLFGVFVSFLIFIPHIVNAAIVNCGNEGGGVSQGCTIPDFIAMSVGFAEYLFAVAGAVAVCVVVYGGVKLVTSSGSPTLVSSAKKTIAGALIGLVIVLFSVFIVENICYLLQCRDLHMIENAPAVEMVHPVVSQEVVIDKPVITPAIESAPQAPFVQSDPSPAVIPRSPSLPAQLLASPVVPAVDPDPHGLTHVVKVLGFDCWGKWMVAAIDITKLKQRFSAGR